MTLKPTKEQKGEDPQVDGSSPPAETDTGGLPAAGTQPTGETASSVVSAETETAEAENVSKQSDTRDSTDHDNPSDDAPDNPSKPSAESNAVAGHDQTAQENGSTNGTSDASNGEVKAKVKEGDEAKIHRDESILESVIRGPDSHLYDLYAVVVSHVMSFGLLAEAALSSEPSRLLHVGPLRDVRTQLPHGKVVQVR